MVQASERKIRLSDVDQEESMGIARREAMGRGIRLRRDESDMLIDSNRVFLILDGFFDGAGVVAC